MRLTLTAGFILAIALSLSVSRAEDGDSETGSDIEQFIQQHAEALGGEVADRHERSEVFDFDGLRSSDVAAVYWIRRDNDATAFLAVFENVDQNWSLTNHVRLGGRGLRHISGVSFAKRSISIKCFEFAGHEPLSSPSLRVTINVTTEKGLINIKRTQHED